MPAPLGLVAMDRSGSTFVLRDRGGRLWLYPPEGAGRPRVLTAGVAERVIARQELERIDRDFPSWPRLEAFRQERAARMTPPTVVDIEGFDLHDVERLLGVADRWRAGGDIPSARRLVMRLLHAPVATRDPVAHERLISALDGLVREPALDIRSEPPSVRGETVRERWESLPQAA